MNHKIITLVKLYFQAYFSHKPVWKILKILFGMAIGAVYGLLLYAMTHVEKSHLNFEQILAGSYLLYFGMRMMGEFVLNYQPRLNLYTGFWPISGVERYVLRLSSELHNMFNIIFLCMYGMSFFLIPDFTVYTLIQALISLLLLSTLLDYLKMILENNFRKNLKKYVVLLWFFLAFISVLIFYFYKGQILSGGGYSLSIGLLYLLSILNLYHFEKFIIPQKQTTMRFAGIFKSPYLQLLFRNRNLLTVILLGLIMKLVFLPLLVHFYVQKNSGIGFLYLFIILSPILLFSYLYNNLWTFVKEFYIVFHLSGKTIQRFLKEYCKILFLPLSVDFLFSLSVAIYLKIAIYWFVFFYLLSSLIFILNGMVLSFMGCKKVDGVFKLGRIGSNTSYLGALWDFALLIAIFLFAKEWYKTAFIVTAVLSGISGVLYLRLVSRFRHYKYKVYQTIFR